MIARTKGVTIDVTCQPVGVPKSLAPGPAKILRHIVASVDPRHFSRVDLPLLEQYATAAHQATLAAQELEKSGAVVDGKASPWLTVQGGSRAYVSKLIADYRGRLRLASPVKAVTRIGGGVLVEAKGSVSERYDRVVIAAHADQALRMLSNPTLAERRVLGAFRYSHNRTVLHGDRGFMPNRRAAWSSWNHQGPTGLSGGCITYWMNKLHAMPQGQDALFVTLNPPRDPADGSVHLTQDYEHPLFDGAAINAQYGLPDLQGEGGVWYCGAYFGSGFHEDGLQSGLAAAEGAGAVRRPWTVENASGRMPVSRRTLGRDLAA